MSHERSATRSSEAETQPCLKLADNPQAAWERRLEAEGMPAELDPHHILARKAYEAFLRDTQVPQELLGLMVDDWKEQPLSPGALPSDNEQSDPVKVAEHTELQEHLHAVLDTLPEREASAILMRGKMTYDQIAEIYGVSRQRMSQIVSRGISRLQEPSRRQFLADYMEERLPDEAPLATQEVRQFTLSVHQELLAQCWRDKGLSNTVTIDRVSQNSDMLFNIINNAAHTCGIVSDQIRPLLLPFYQTLLKNSTQEIKKPQRADYDGLCSSIIDVLKARF